MHPVFRALVIGLLAMLTTACSTGPVSSIWTDPGHTPTRYHRVVVFGVTNSPKVRRAYEDNFVERLRALGVSATPGHRLVSDANLRLLVRLTEGYSRADADAVIITHLITDAPPDGQPASRLGAIPDHYRNLVPYFSQVYEEVCEPGYYKDAKALRLETNLYDAKRERLVWSGRSRPLDTNSEQTTISQVIEDVITQMAMDGYLPNPSAGSGQIAQ
ncbi:hypothetical protein [Thiocystis violacea]|uniref:hypothetical protein n=1 Tax=Thiocystis violacea TaxID=13725 RepID=UPI001905C2F0|nr:hypothetical protein [Thiocystis violacea]MBK1719284.1 hypothetical protein [Thiocystis violacea]